MQQTVLILGGSGKAGSHAADAFWNAGWTIRQYKRGTDMTQAAIGADVIVNGLNPPNYHNWAKTIPTITGQVIAAAKASGATVILPGNIYNFGNQPGTFDERTPQHPHTRKGKIRAAQEQSYRQSGVQTIVLRAGNFIAPGSHDDIMSSGLMRNIHNGRLTALGPADTVQAYCYMPDWARAAVMLAEKRDTLATFEDVPFPGHSFTYRKLCETVNAASGKTHRLTAFPWWVMHALSPFWELAREMAEMRYLFAMPHKISAEKFDQLLPAFQPTDLHTVMLAGLPADIHPDKVMRSGKQPITV
ncbi:NAD-dependent epimerase/dehydratase family protein [Loktanella agnita]|uniref:NAD-dependent epimerase/dehydratase family protein n=1 Tax=Loktanella agnita TaxID=287097 RepID=UPI0039866B57